VSRRPVRVMSVVGARPNFMKIAPFVRAIADRNAADPGGIEHRLVHTGQHYEARMSDAFFRELATLFLEDMPRNLQNLQRALDRPDPETAMRLAHGLKGTTRTFGVETLATLFLRIEWACRERRFLEALAKAQAGYDRVEQALQRFLARGDA